MNSLVIKCNRYSKLKNRILERYPKTKIKYKENHWFWKHLPHIFRSSSNTFFNTIWMSEKNCDFISLGHEYQHLVDFYRLGFIKMALLYLWPQIIALPCMILAIIALAFGLNIVAIIAFIIAILFLLPWPSTTRTCLEAKGYKATILGILLTIQVDDDELKNNIVDSLMSWLYYKMVWKTNKAKSITDTIVKDNQINSTALKDIYEILTDTTS